MFTRRRRRKNRRNTRKFKGGKHTWKTRGIQAAKLAGVIGTTAYLTHLYTKHKMNKKLLNDDEEKKADQEAEHWNEVNGKLYQEREKARQKKEEEKADREAFVWNAMIQKREKEQQKKEEDIIKENYEIREETKRMADELIKNARQAANIRVRGKYWL